MAVANAEVWLTQPAVSPAASNDMLEQTMNESMAGVKFLAGRLANRLPAHVDVEDLVQVGLMGLLQCAQRFDSDRGVKFQTYANRRVQGAMLDYLRSLDWRPRSVRKRSRRLAQAVAAVEQRTGESACEEDLAAELGMSSPELREWLQDYCSRGEHATINFSDRGNDEGSEDLMALIADPADSPETVVEKCELRDKLALAVENLPENERVVLTLYYFEQKTMREIGRKLGVKQARVSQLHSQALRRLRLRLRRDVGILAASTPATPFAEVAPERIPVAETITEVTVETPREAGRAA